MRRLDLYALDRVVQDRIVASARGGYSPPLIAAAPTPVRVPPWWVLGGALGAMLLVVLPVLGWGSLGSSLGRQGALFLLVYILAASGVTLLSCRVAARIHARATSPVRPGLYLFPGTALEVDGAELRAFPATELSRAAAQGALVLLHYGQQTLRFAAGDANRAQEIVAELLSARDKILSGQLLPEASDPLQSPKFASPVGPVAAHARVSSFWDNAGLGIAALLGLLFGTILWWGRNTQSDESMYAKARTLNTKDAYEAYLVSGTAHADEVRGIDLPRVSAARAESLEARIEKAKTAGDAAALRALGAELGAPLLTLTHPVDCKAAPGKPDPCAPFLVAAALASIGDANAASSVFARPKGDLAEAAAWSRIFRAAALTGGVLRLDVTHGKPDGAQLARADKYLTKSTSYAGEVSRVSKHFDEASEVERDARDFAAIKAAFEARVPPDRLRLAASTETAAPDAGRLEVTRTTVWSGRVYTSKTPRGVFLGMTYTYELKLTPRGEAKPFVRKAQAIIGVDNAWMSGPGSDSGPKAVSDFVYAEQSMKAVAKASDDFFAVLAPSKAH